MESRAKEADQSIPSDSYNVLGSLAAGATSLQPSIKQLPEWHRTTQPEVHHAGGRDESTTGVLAAATALKEATGRGAGEVPQPCPQTNGAIRWFDSTDPAID